MVPNLTINKIESLGSYLREKRKEKHLEIADIEFETKIPPKTLRAMEADDTVSLPAEAFARGFYILYAKCLELNIDHVLERYQQLRCLPPKVTNEESAPIIPKKTVDTLAARPMVSLSSLMGLGLVIIIITIAGICWYMSWNPATFISERLRSFQEPQTIENNNDDAKPTTTNENQDKTKDLSSHVSPTPEGTPLVVMSAKTSTYSTKQGIIFITIPPSDTLEN